MRRILCTSVLVAFLTVPVTAQEDEPPSLMERGAQQFLEGLLLEMEPAFEGMKDFMDQMGPAMLGLLEEIQDWSVYEAPEILENGDIIIRRKPEVEPPEETAPSKPAELPPQIEL